MPETCVRPLGQEDPLEKEMATLSGILAWEIPQTEEPGGLQSTGWQRAGHDLATQQEQYTEQMLSRCPIWGRVIKRSRIPSRDDRDRLGTETGWSLQRTPRLSLAAAGEARAVQHHTLPPAFCTPLGLPTGAQPRRTREASLLPEVAKPQRSLPSAPDTEKADTEAVFQCILIKIPSSEEFL